MNKIIYTDCDGVLLDWLGSAYRTFEEWGHEIVDESTMTLHKRFGVDKQTVMIDMIEQFNKSARIGYLHAEDGAIKYVRKLYEEYGYQFHVITSVGSDPYVHMLREANLKRHFGDAILFIDCLDLEVSKKQHLERVPKKERGETWWIEDFGKNAEEGFELGFKTILLNRSYNQDCDAQDDADPANCIVRADNWKHVYEEITGQWTSQ